ncbi:hypothetical protein F5Y14DRAFT_395253 [Nemania sp. NC0429]|nr:hypothetical protein F5Y14DRAFT_395253 [Nemania sp. NC0429]
MSHLPQPATKRTRYEIMALSVGLIGLSALFLGLTAVDIWAAARPYPQIEFAARFWKRRFWMLDAPREWLFLAWLSFLALHSLYCAIAARHELSSREYDNTVEERKWLRGSSEDGTDEEK